MTVKNAFLLFEQSGTFKRAFENLGIAAKDYDIANDFGITDVVCDLFFEIKSAYNREWSIFENITPDDIIIAFFPCTYFCGNNTMFFDGTQKGLRNLSLPDKIDKIIERDNMRHFYYVKALQLCKIVEERNLRMIVENPYNAHHYWRFNFPYKPAVIDMNRRTSGDFYKKPTQYLFVNCTPAGRKSVQMDKEMHYVCNQSTVNRSMISEDYAHNFICDHILGIESGHTQPTLFN